MDTQEVVDSLESAIASMAKNTENTTGDEAEKYATAANQLAEARGWLLHPAHR